MFSIDPHNYQTALTWLLDIPMFSSPEWYYLKFNTHTQTHTHTHRLSLSLINRAVLSKFNAVFTKSAHPIYLQSGEKADITECLAKLYATVHIQCSKESCKRKTSLYKHFVSLCFRECLLFFYGAFQLVLHRPLPHPFPACLPFLFKNIWLFTGCAEGVTTKHNNFFPQIVHKVYSFFLLFFS